MLKKENAVSIILLVVIFSLLGLTSWLLYSSKNSIGYFFQKQDKSYNDLNKTIKYSNRIMMVRKEVSYDKDNIIESMKSFQDNTCAVYFMNFSMRDIANQMGHYSNESVYFPKFIDYYDNKLGNKKKFLIQRKKLLTRIIKDKAYATEDYYGEKVNDKIAIMYMLSDINLCIKLSEINIAKDEELGLYIK